MAGEVEDLARESAEATGIGRRVAAIPQDTGDVAGRPTSPGSIARTSSHQTGVAGAVEERTAATDGLQQRMAGTAVAAADIVERLREVSRTAATTDDRAGQARRTATELGALTDELDAVVGSSRTWARGAAPAEGGSRAPVRLDDGGGGPSPGRPGGVARRRLRRRAGGVPRTRGRG